MGDFPGCWDCIFNENQEWFVTHDFTQECHHNPKPKNLTDIREGDAPCIYYKENA